ncbi:hypothetical protein J3P89_09690 [Pseudomonas sp. Z1-14]|uniref:hypothetical protein n=1 Tax=Pseudomonas sp. Z1-14 TaxID=2817409 RepID=UPI003DAA43FC
MKLSLYNYELLNFDSANAVSQDKGFARSDSPAILKSPKDLQLGERITRSDIDALPSNRYLVPRAAVIKTPVVT